MLYLVGLEEYFAFLAPYAKNRHLIPKLNIRKKKEQKYGFSKSKVFFFPIKTRFFADTTEIGKA